SRRSPSLISGSGRRRRRSPERALARHPPGVTPERTTCAWSSSQSGAMPAGRRRARPFVHLPGAVPDVRAADGTGPGSCPGHGGGPRCGVAYPGGMRMRPTLSWTPTEGLPPAATDLEAVAGALGDGGVLVLSGAGLSTESGIPDCRGAGGRLSRHTPMTYQDFVAGAGARRRYWARSHLGRRTFVRARPNAGHRAVAAF